VVAYMSLFLFRIGYLGVELVEDNFEITELDIEKYLAQENAVI